MKIFIVAALLVASVASMDMDIKFNKDTKSMLKFDRPVYPMVHDYRNNMVDNYKYNNYFGDYDMDTTTVYQLDEIMTHPMFREYMSLPLFRQYWQYPMFQRYVASIHFQRFWQIPTFQQYFINPTLFYKYIYPIVQLFKYEDTTMNAYPYNTGYDYETIYGQKYDMPAMCQYNYGYCQTLMNKMYQSMYSMMMPYTSTSTSMDYNRYNPYTARMIQGYYNRYPTFETENMTPYTYNQERMYNNDNMHFNKIVDDDMTFTPRMYENVRPTINHMMRMKSFDKKMIPEMTIKA